MAENIPTTINSQPTTHTTQNTSSSVYPFNLNTIGDYIDGWADVIENMGSKADQVRDEVFDQLKDREMPQIGIYKVSGYDRVSSFERRPITITRTNPGVTTTINISTHGKDLYVSWRTFIRLTLNKNLLVILLILPIFFGGVSFLRAFMSSLSNDRIANPFFSAFISGGGLFVVELLLVMVAGRLLKGNFQAYLFIEPRFFDAEDITAMSLAVHKTILRTLDKIGIDITKLRLKQEFKGGRKADDI